MDALDFKVRLVADLGCGSGDRVIQVLSKNPHAGGIGIDISPAAVDMARREAGEAGLAERTSFVEADVLKLQPSPAFEEVDLLTCFMMGHDFWPRQSCISTLARLREAFPNVRRLILGDATRSGDIADLELPIFTLGFELAHDLMGAFLPTAQDWESVFEECGWKLRSKHPIDVAVGEIIFDLERW